MELELISLVLLYLKTWGIRSYKLVPSLIVFNVNCSISFLNFIRSCKLVPIINFFLCDLGREWWSWQWMEAMTELGWPWGGRGTNGFFLHFYLQIQFFLQLNLLFWPPKFFYFEWLPNFSNQFQLCSLF